MQCHVDTILNLWHFGILSVWENLPEPCQSTTTAEPFCHGTSNVLDSLILNDFFSYPLSKRYGSFSIEFNEIMHFPLYRQTLVILSHEFKPSSLTIITFGTCWYQSLAGTRHVGGVLAMLVPIWVHEQSPKRRRGPACLTETLTTLPPLLKEDSGFAFAEEASTTACLHEGRLIASHLCCGGRLTNT